MVVRQVPEPTEVLVHHTRCPSDDVKSPKDKAMVLQPLVRPIEHSIVERKKQQRRRKIDSKEYKREEGKVGACSANYLLYSRGIESMKSPGVLWFSRPIFSLPASFA